MNSTLIILSVLLIALILYFLINAYFPLQNKINTSIKLTSRKVAISYLSISLLFVPALFGYYKYTEDQLLAEKNGFKNYAAYEAELNRAKSFNLTLEKYQEIMVLARTAGFKNYVDYQNHMIAKEHGYDTFLEYRRNLQLAKSYGFPLSVYKKAKAEADAKEFQYFDDYLVFKEKDTLKKKLPLITKLDGDYKIENVPLGIVKDDFFALVEDCKVSEITNYAFPNTMTLAPRSDAYVNHFFPPSGNDNHFGLAAYSLNFTVKPGLDRNAITKYEMKCESNRYDLWFLNSDNSLVMYEKTINMPIRNFDTTVKRVEETLAAKCDTDITIGLETEFEENGTRTIKNLYCKKFQHYIIATIIDGPTITDLRQEPDIHIGYLSDRLWKKYINNLHAVKGKKRNAKATLTQNAKKAIDDRI